MRDIEFYIHAPVASRASHAKLRARSFVATNSGETRAVTDLKQTLDHKPDGSDRYAPTSSGSLLADRLRALSLVTEALGAMVRADYLALAERSTCIDAFEREADGLMRELLVEPSFIGLPARS